MKIALLNKISDLLFRGFLSLCLVWVVSALSLQIFFIYLVATDQDERSRNIVNAVEWKFDGTFKNSPENIFYQGASK
jgi:hypothetical protein